VSTKTLSLSSQQRNILKLQGKRILLLSQRSMVMAKLVFYASMRSGSGLGLFPVTYRNDFEMTEKN